MARQSTERATVNASGKFELTADEWREYQGLLKKRDNTVISIGRGGKRSIYTIADSDALIVDNLLERLGKKNE